MSNSTSAAEEIELGKLLRKRYPTVSPYEAARRAAEQLYPHMSLSDSAAAPKTKGALAETEFSSFMPLQGAVRAHPAELIDYAEKAKVPGSDYADWEAGVYGHEMLGHGGDAAINKDYARASMAPPGAADSHFMRNSNSPYDSIRWLIDDTKARLKSPEEIRLEEQEARRRGLPLVLPSELKNSAPREY